MQRGSEIERCYVRVSHLMMSFLIKWLIQQRLYHWWHNTRHRQTKGSGQNDCRYLYGHGRLPLHPATDLQEAGHHYQPEFHRRASETSCWRTWSMACDHSQHSTWRTGCTSHHCGWNCQSQTSNVTGHHRAPKHKLRAGYTACPIYVNYSSARPVLFFHRRVWYCTLSMCMRVLCAYSKFGHHPHPLGYPCAKFCFCRALRCRASPRRKYLITHSVIHIAY